VSLYRRLHPAIVMTAENCLDAALAGLDLGEAVTFPSVENASELAGRLRCRAIGPTRLINDPKARVPNTSI
jgi:hypothetical protein